MAGGFQTTQLGCVWGDGVPAPCDKDPAFQWPVAPCEGPRVKIHGRNSTGPGGQGLGLPTGEGSPWGARNLPALRASTAAWGFQRSWSRRKGPALELFQLREALHPARGSGAVGWRRGPVSHGPNLLPTGCLPRLQARDSRLSTVPVRRLLLKETNCLKKATSELHLFLLRVNNFVYSVMFRNLCNFVACVITA